MVKYNISLVNSLLASSRVGSIMNSFASSGRKGLTHIYLRPNDQSSGGAKFTFIGGHIPVSDARKDYSWPLSTEDGPRAVEWQVEFEGTDKPATIKCTSTVPGHVQRQTGILIFSEPPYILPIDKELNVLEELETGVSVVCFGDSKHSGALSYRELLEWEWETQEQVSVKSVSQAQEPKRFGPATPEERLEWLLRELGL